ncbi:MAG: nuclear transport factor 2 family protein [Pseudoxanthomonas sp.]
MPAINADKLAVSKLDLRFQAAVKANDAETIDEILDENFALVLGTGETQTKSDQLNDARSGAISWQRQEEEPGTQVVRVWGNTAVVTAKLWIKGRHGTREFDRKVWFSDTYVRRNGRWKYVFGQVSLPQASD